MSNLKASLFFLTFLPGVTFGQHLINWNQPVDIFSTGPYQSLVATGTLMDGTGVTATLNSAPNDIFIYSEIVPGAGDFANPFFSSGGILSGNALSYSYLPSTVTIVFDRAIEVELWLSDLPGYDDGTGAAGYNLPISTGNVNDFGNATALHDASYDNTTGIITSTNILDQLNDTFTPGGPPVHGAAKIDLGITDTIVLSPPTGNRTSHQVHFTIVDPTPEPSSLLLLGISVYSLVSRRDRKTA